MSETYAPTNEQAVARSQREAFQRAGLPKRFFDTRLESVTGGPEMRQRIIDGSLFAAMKDGRGLTVSGDPRVAYPLFALTMRGLILSSVHCRFVSLIDLVQAQDDKWLDYLSTLETCASLFIWGFVSAEDCPLTSWQKARVSRLIVGRHDEQRPTFLHLDREAKLEDWWGRMLCEIVGQTNIDVVL